MADKVVQVDLLNVQWVKDMLAHAAEEIGRLTAEVRTCTEVARIAQGHADQLRLQLVAAHDALDEARAEVERLKAANANLIRNAEILADEIVLGTTATFGPVSPVAEWWEDKP